VAICKLVQILCFWALSIVLSSSKNTVLFIFETTTFRRLDSVSVFRLGLIDGASTYLGISEESSPKRCISKNKQDGVFR
jgi:hypothetical protein